jgi:hypothetical protein
MGDTDQRVREVAYFLWQGKDARMERRTGIGDGRKRLSKLKTPSGRKLKASRRATRQVKF